MLSEYEAQKLHADTALQLNLTAKQRLLWDTRGEPAWRLATALKCVACSVVLGGLALIGARTDPQVQSPVGAATESAQNREPESIVGVQEPRNEVTESERMPASVSGGTVNADARATVKAEHHRKAVFDERRHAWEQRRYSEDKRIAGRSEP